VVGCDRGIGAGTDRDLVLATFIYDDQRDAGRFTWQDGDVGDVDPFAPEISERRRAGVVVANGADQPNTGAGVRSSDRGVRALAAAVRLHAAADDGFSGARQSRRDDNQVDVDRADDDHGALVAVLVAGKIAALFGHSAETSTRASLKLAPPARSDKWSGEKTLAV
jgi:hypothetical protein